MIGFIIRRIGQAIIVIIGVTVIVFILRHLLPGNIARAILGIRATPPAIAAFNRQNGLDKPLVHVAKLPAFPAVLSSRTTQQVLGPRPSCFGRRLMQSARKISKRVA